MKLINFLEIADENANYMILSDEMHEELARYDGRNSIPTELNNREIVSVFAYEYDGELFTVVIVREG